MHCPDDGLPDCGVCCDHGSIVGMLPGTEMRCPENCWAAQVYYPLQEPPLRQPVSETKETTRGK